MDFKYPWYTSNREGKLEFRNVFSFNPNFIDVRRYYESTLLLPILELDRYSVGNI